MEKRKIVNSLRALIFVQLSHLCSSFYLPGAAPQAYCEADAPGCKVCTTFSIFFRIFYFVVAPDFSVLTNFLFTQKEKIRTFFENLVRISKAVGIIILCFVYLNELECGPIHKSHKQQLYMYILKLSRTRLRGLF